MDALSSSWSSNRAVLPSATAPRARGRTNEVAPEAARAGVNAGSSAAGGYAFEPAPGSVHRLGPRAHNTTLAMLVYQDSASPGAVVPRHIDTFA